MVIACHDRYYDGPALTAFSSSLVWCLLWWGQAIGHSPWWPLLGVLSWCLIFKASHYTPCFNEVEKGVYTGVYTLSVCLCILPSARPSVDRVVSTLYLEQYSPDPFQYLNIFSSNLIRCVVCKVFLKIIKWNFWQILYICIFYFVRFYFVYVFGI